MKRVLCAALACSAALLAGCISTDRFSFTLDLSSGEVTRVYHDLRSRQGPTETDYSVERDWASLQEMAADTDPEFNSNVVAEVRRELFREGEALSGRRVQRVLCPPCFPSLADLLKYLNPEGWRFEEANGEILAIVPAGRKVVSANGKLLSSDRNTFIVWPTNATEIAFEVTDPSSGGEPLLPYFQGERGKSAADAATTSGAP